MTHYIHPLQNKRKERYWGYQNGRSSNRSLRLTLLYDDSGQSGVVPTLIYADKTWSAVINQFPLIRYFPFFHHCQITGYPVLNTISYSLFPDVDTHSTKIPHTAEDHGIFMLTVNNILYPWKQTGGDEFNPYWNIWIDIRYWNRVEVVVWNYMISRTHRIQENRPIVDRYCDVRNAGICQYDEIAWLFCWNEHEVDTIVI